MLLHDVVEVAGRQVSQDALLGFDANRADGLLDVRVEAREAEGVADTEQVFLFGHVAEGGLVDHHLEVDLALFILRLHVELDRAAALARADQAEHALAAIELLPPVLHPWLWAPYPPRHGPLRRTQHREF